MAHSVHNLLFESVQLEMITTIDKKPDISMLTAVTDGSLCPAYTVISPTFYDKKVSTADNNLLRRYVDRILHSIVFQLPGGSSI